MARTVDTARASDAPAVRGVYLLTHPRSASNLFQTMMEKQPGYEKLGYKLFQASFAALGQLDKGRLSKWPEEERKALYDNFQTCFEKLEDELEDAKKNGNQVFVKEHAIFLAGPDKLFASLYPDDDPPAMVVRQRHEPPESVHTNPTSLPDSFMLSLQPIFQIRHPALMFPSMIRAMRDPDIRTPPFGSSAKVTLTLGHSRALYDWYLAHGGELTPRIIDADDIMNDRAAVRRLCIETGLDPDAVQYEWEEKHLEDPIQARFLSTISKSKGILPGLGSKGLNIETEKEKWKKEFGDKDGETLAGYVSDAMDDYNYMLSRRTRGE
ncbi:hypothetical protein BDW02DRAFT_573478 [Decorospora gaudefroyi]|uniref:Uncharacterized protein n=1 Tax=Decorospora gaudefroyi TaxID=184978 RepID=A0A6A5JYF4_9PLEO|nr:hypothetical protein BDW02DRAFT_573478 [Decorospora gaudefroyi]